MTSDATTPPAAEPPAYDPWSAMPPAVAPPTEQFPVIAAPEAPVTPAPTAPFPAPPSTAHFPAAPQFSAPPAQFSAPPAPPAGAVAPFHGSAGAPGPYPPAGPVPPAQSAVAVQIAEIMVTPPVIRTPAGVLPLAGASWYVTDFWQKEEKIAPWAVVAAILGFFCLTVFSLLFLLIKETRHYGTVQVTVSSGGHQYVARIPVTDQFQVQQLNNQVNYARSLSAG
ncbi:hypothetical protein ACQP26_24225 [Micromonospora sp. CA-248089]|uniref:hypothetical protein n=1 Tax=Micromonospora sp. CA-248089 TaxID=3239960 RepID=UPI003D8D7041